MHINWFWIALIAFLIFCCVPMLFMGRGKRDRHSPGEVKKEDEESND